MTFRRCRAGLQTRAEPPGSAIYFFSRAHARQLLLTLSLLPTLFGQSPQPDGARIRPGVLPKHWITGGPNCIEIPDWQVHEYNSDFYILRESGCTHYEKPFLYLLFGKDKVLLEDTGAGKAHVAGVVEDLIQKWMARNQRHSIALIVAHSHAHGDHIAGDRQLEDLHNPGIAVTLVPLTPAGTAQFYAIENWPQNTGHIDLGDRVIDVIPIPGHDRLSVALYDRQTGLLLTGDSLYPSRLYIPIAEFVTYTDSIQRLVDFTEGKIIAHIFGTHIEQSSTPYLDYPVGTAYQPEEHALELSRGHLLELNRALEKMHGKPVRVALRDFTIWPK